MARSPEKPRRVIPRSIAARGAILLLIATGSVLVPGFIAHRYVLGWSDHTQSQETEALLSMTLAAYLEALPEPAPEHDAWLAKVQPARLRIPWAGVFDTDGTGLEFRRRIDLDQAKIIEQIDFDASTAQSRRLRIDGVVSQRYDLIAIPRPGEEIILAAIVDRGTDRPGTGLLVVLLLIGAAGISAGFVWFHCTIERPLRHVGTTLVQSQEDVAELLGDAVPAELAEVVATVDQTRRELREWRGEATQLRHSVDRQVDARTKKAAQAQRRAEKEAGIDPLTRLENRRVLERDLPGTFHEHEHSGEELALMVIDVDHFKVLNDTLGHKAGDELLAFLGELIRATIRKGTDRAVRYGGDEFVVILPSTTAVAACKIGQRITSLFAQRTRSMKNVNPLPVLSAGIAALRQHQAGSWEDLLHQADAAMYCAKRSGRGVATYDDFNELGCEGPNDAPRGAAAEKDPRNATDRTRR